MNKVLSFLIFASGKNFAKKFCAKLVQVVMNPYGNKLNQLLTLSQKKKGKSLNLTVSLDTPLNLKVSHISRKLIR